ncbi:MAG: hypothetical protein JRH20_23975 [Deltaproteobacteria bacterium]|nr:hypothetical protein [Deltaproteobacteria bacterium]
MMAREKFSLVLGMVALFAAGCGEGVIAGGAASIHGENPENTSFEQLSRRSTGDEYGVPGESADLESPDESRDPQPAGSVESTPFEQIEQLDINTESRCHVGDLDNGQAGFWENLNVFPQADVADADPDVANPDALRGDALYTFAVEAADGTLLGSVVLGIDELTNAQQEAAPDVTHKLSEAIKLQVPQRLMDQGSFFVNLFACVDSDKDGSCSDEDVKPPEEDDTPKWWPEGMTMPDPLGPAMEEVDSRLMASLALKASFDGQKLVFESAPESGVEGLPLDLANWFDASEFTEGLLNNIPTQGGLTGSMLKLTLAVRVADHTNVRCAFSNRDMGCFVAGTQIQVGPHQTLPIEKLVAGSMITTADGRQLTSLRAVAGPESEPVIAISTLSGHTLTLTSKHPVKTRMGIKIAAELNEGDELFTAEGSLTGITSLRRKSYGGTVFNFALPGDGMANHLVVANGLVVGDLYLQQKLAGR